MKRSPKTFDHKYLFGLAIKDQQSQDFLTDRQVYFWQYLKHIEVHFRLHLLSISNLHSCHHRSHWDYLTCDTLPHTQKYLCRFHLVGCQNEILMHGGVLAWNLHNLWIAIGHLKKERSQIKFTFDHILFHKIMYIQIHKIYIMKVTCLLWKRQRSHLFS